MSTTTTPATPPATVPASQVIPFPTPWMTGPNLAGCCPPGGGLGALNECYLQIQQAMSFLSAIMIDLMNNNPQVQAAMVAGIEKSGLPLAITGITTGVAATPGQVGETFQNTVPGLPYANVYTTQQVSLGILPAGDWLVWVSVDTFTTAAAVVTGIWTPVPTGFTPLTLGGAGPLQGTTVVSKPVQALISTATLMTAQIGLQGSASGSCSANVLALRVR